jgi:hypothetical protein
MMKKQTFEEFFAKHSDKNAKPYEFREHYHENVIVTHPKFGKGFVSEILSDSKAEVTFKDSRRVLVHNRKDMPGLPLAAEGDGHPSNSKISKNGKVKAVKETPVVAAKPTKTAPAKAPKPAAIQARVPAKISPAAKSAKAAKPTKTAPKPARAAIKPAPKAKPAKAAKPRKK